MKPYLLCCLLCLPLAHLAITSPFGYRSNPVTGVFAFHNGVDLKARSDTVYAIAHGIIYTTGYDPLLGISVSIDHSGFTTIYGHLSRLFVIRADTVTTGQPIGITGHTGRVTGEHLHFSVRVKNRYTDPLEFIYQLINTKNHE